MSVIEGVVPVWAVWTNTDLTEGRGREYIKCFCEIEATAQRIAKGGYVMGTDGRVTQESLIRVDGKWYGPGPLREPPSVADKQREAELSRERAARAAKAAALERARTLGLTDEEIAALSG